MKKTLLFALAGALLLSSCAEADIVESSFRDEESVSATAISNSEEEREEAPLPEVVARFVSAVEAIGAIDIDSGDSLNQLIVLYYAVSYSYGDYLDRPEVKKAKEKMDGYIEEYKALLEERIDDELNLAYERRFLDFCRDNLPDESHLLLEQRYLVNVALAYYASLADESKAKAEVIEAKAKVDALLERCEALANMSGSQYAAYEFVIKMEALVLEEILYQDKSTVDELNEMYDRILPDDRSEDVMKAKSKLDQVNARMEELETMQQHAAAFMEAAWALPSNLRYHDSAQQAAINNALALYDALTKEEKEIAGVEEAYQNVLSVKAAFEALQEPFDIKAVSPGWAFYPTNQMTFGGGNPYSSIASRYGYSMNEVESKALIKVYIYRDGAIMRDGIPSGELYASFYLSKDNYTVTLHGGGHSVYDILADEGYTDIRSMRICFTVQIESKVDDYGTSYFSEIFGRLYIADQDH